MTEELLLTRYERAWNLHDHRECAACFAADGSRECRIAGTSGARGALTLRGRRAIADHTAMVMLAVADLALGIESLGYCSDRRLWVEWRLTGTHSGDLGPWRADGRRIEVLGAAVFRLSNAGFLEERLYWDTAHVGGTGTVDAEPARA